jgi:hypothetical protein
MQELIKIRAHHLNVLGSLLYYFDESSLDERIRNLKKDKYIPKNAGKDHPFVKFVYSDLVRVLQDPNSEIMVVRNEPDVFCNNCHNKNPACYSEKHFDADVFYADIYDLHIGKKYPADYVGNVIKKEAAKRAF